MRSSNQGPTMVDNGTTKDTTASTGGEGTPKNSSRKRKADELSDEETPHLPAPVWGHVLDFMPYTEVRSALLVGKHIAVEAAKYVQTLNIMRGSEMFIPAARRFTNVEEVNILCFLEVAGEEHAWVGDFFSISMEVSSRAVPFLGSFAKLARGFIGGLDSNGVRKKCSPYLVQDRQEFRQSIDVYRNLLTAYVGAIKSGALSEKTALEGMTLCSLAGSSCRESSSNCLWCKNILSHYPALCDLLRFLFFHRSDSFCQTEQEAWDIVRRRPDFDKDYSEMSEELLCGYVSIHLGRRIVKNQFRAAAVEHLPEKWRLAEQHCENLWVYSISQSNLQKIDVLMTQQGFSRHVTRKIVLEEWDCDIGANHLFTHLRFCAWTKTTVENFAARGFPVDCDCVPVIDDKYYNEKYSDCITSDLE